MPSPHLWTACIALLFAGPLPGDELRPDDIAKEPVDYAIVVTGGELLSGAYADGHTHFSTRTLRPLGLRCVTSVSVDDNAENMKRALAFAASRSQLVIVTGGLGPTDNDITRQTLSEFTGVPLQENDEVLKLMEQRYRTTQKELRPNLRRQALTPIRGTFLPNFSGSAAGLVFELAELVVVALPGPPRELEPMVMQRLVPYLHTRFGTRQLGCSLTIRFVGLGQSQVDQTMNDHIPLPADIVLSSQFADGRVDFTFSLPKDAPEDRARLDRLKEQLMEHLGEYIYATDDSTLEASLIDQLRRRGVTLAVAEIGSRGSLAAALNGAADSGAVLRGSFVAPNASALTRMLGGATSNTGSAPTPAIQQWANNAAAATGSQWAIVIGDIRYGSDESGQLAVALRTNDGDFKTQRFGFRGQDASARARLITQVLDWLRKTVTAG